MIREKRLVIYKIIISLLFGIISFFVNFHTIIFQFGEYTVAVLFGLLLPLLITLSWGWKYGLISALFGGCQTMWWLWGPSNGYAVFFVVPPFTLWILWHGIWNERRKRKGITPGLLNLFLTEIPFRLLNSLNILTITRLAVRHNPPPWAWGADSALSIPMEFSLFIVIKQASVALALLVLADLMLNFNPVRRFFRLEMLVDQRRTGYLVSFSLAMGGVYWLLDSLYFTATGREGRTFIDYFVRDVPGSNLFVRMVFLFFCLIFGIAMARIMRRQKEHEMALKRAREEAENREVFQETLINTIPDAIWLKNVEGVYLTCNARYAEISRRKSEDIIGSTDFDLFPDPTAIKFIDMDRKVIDEGRSILYLTDNKKISPDNSLQIETIKAPMYDGKGKIIGVLGIGRDITERISLQKQLVQAQKMESVGRLAGGVAHDFNNMIGVILGESDLMLDELSQDDPLREYVREIQNAAERSENLTRQLLAFARKQTISPRIIDLNQAVDSVLKMLRRLIGENVELEWNPREGLGSLYADPVQIDQILANLCVNAKDAIEGIGKITIATENVYVDEDDCRKHEGFRKGEYIVLSVGDTGHGMDSSTLEHIFEPFYTTKKRGQGTGLGLAMIYGIMVQHKGWVHVESEPGRGSVFQLYFPRAADERGITCADDEPDDGACNPGSGTILLVEDEEAMLAVIKKQLEKLGYRVIAHQQAEKAIELSSSEKEIDLLITDVIMPEMNGKEVFLKVRETHPEVKCLFISGYTGDVISRQGILEENLNFLGKPFNREELGRKIRQILGRE